MNIDELSQETLWKLYSFVNEGATDGLTDAMNARERGNATDQVEPAVCCYIRMLQSYVSQRAGIALHPAEKHLG